jgi:hypothetical protein
MPGLLDAPEARAEKGQKASRGRRFKRLGRHGKRCLGQGPKLFGQAIKVELIRL